MIQPPHRQCYSGNRIFGQLTATGCDTPCPGNTNQICGGNDHILVYENLGWYSASLQELASILREIAASQENLRIKLSAWIDAVEAETGSARKRGLEGRQMQPSKQAEDQLARLGGSYSRSHRHTQPPQSRVLASNL
jgi:hypothetical protein